MEGLRVLVEAYIRVPHSPATTTSYGLVAEKRDALRRQLTFDNSSIPGDADVWIIAQALEHSVPYVSHDRGAVRLAGTMGLPVLTALSMEGGNG